MDNTTGLKYDKELEGTIKLQIDNKNNATVSGTDFPTPVVVKLESDEEAQKMIAEFEDDTGDSMHEEDAIFSKYPELHQFRP